MIVGYGIHNAQFDRIQKTALRIWKTLGHEKSSGQELHVQLRKYLEKVKPYSSSYTPNQDTSYLWWNSIINGHLSLSRLVKIIFSITSHLANCERLFSSLGWLFGKWRINLSIQILESMTKIYRYNVSHNNKKLNHVTSNDNDVQWMLDLVYEEGDLLNKNDDDNGESILNELVEEESSQIIDMKLGIKT